MSPVFRDPHPTCARCRSRKCSFDVTCDICKDWSVAQWEAFLIKCPYSGRRTSRPSGSSLPPAPLPIPPSASASSEAGRHSPSPHSPSFPSEGSGRAGKSEGVSRVDFRGVSSPPSRSSAGEEGGWGGVCEDLGFWGWRGSL